MCSTKNFFSHFLLLDVGHPMTPDCLLLIKNSLLDILSLAHCQIGNSTIPVLGFGVLERDLRIIQQLKLRENYWEIEKNLHNMENSLKFGIKYTLQDYRTLLVTTISKIVSDFQINQKFNEHQQYWPNKIIITLMTKKSAKPIQKLLKDISFAEQPKKIEIVEISSNEESLRILNENINITIISENVRDVEGIFKMWLTENEPESEQLRIVLNRDSGFHIKCDMKECALNPINLPLDQSFLKPDNFSSQIFHTLFLKDVKIYEMEVINKILISDVCPSKLFGFPKYIYTTRSCKLSMAELQYNEQLFKALCAELFEQELGLLTKVTAQFNDVTATYFIISDGAKLLIRNIIPVELQLPLLPESLKTSAPINGEVNFAVQSLIDQLRITQEIPPDSTHLYEHFRKLLNSEQYKKCNNEEFEGTRNINCRKVTKSSPKRNEYTLKYREDMISSNRKRSGKQNGKKLITNERRKSPVLGVIHPALLSPETASKYRKPRSYTYLLPEVLEPGMVEK